MKRFSLMTLLAVSVGMLALPDDADARHRRGWRRCARISHCCPVQTCQPCFQASYQACPCPSQHIAGGYYGSQPGYIASDSGYAPQSGDVPPAPGYGPSQPDQFTSTEPRPAGEFVEVGAYDGRGFEPKVISIEPGTTVRWTNHGDQRHTVTARNEMFDSELQPGETFSFTFDEAGTFDYFCRPHEEMGMVGTVEVKDASEPAGSEAPDAGSTPTSGQSSRSY